MTELCCREEINIISFLKMSLNNKIKSDSLELNSESSGFISHQQTDCGLMKVMKVMKVFLTCVSSSSSSESLRSFWSRCGPRDTLHLRQKHKRTPH